MSQAIPNARPLGGTRPQDINKGFHAEHDTPGRSRTDNPQPRVSPKVIPTQGDDLGTPLRGQRPQSINGK